MQNEKIVARVLFDLSISTPIVSYPLFLFPFGEYDSWRVSID
jgi:hypothetical protein